MPIVPVVPIAGRFNESSSSGPVGTYSVPTRFPYSTVTLLARLRGLSMSVPRATAVW